MNRPNNPTPKAYTANKELKSIIGNATPLGKIFSKEKMEKCQQIVDDARESFFEVAADDMKQIDALCNHQLSAETYKDFYAELFQPVSNIKGQADIFNFSLIATTCRHLLNYSSKVLEKDPIKEKHLFIVSQLIEALRKCFNQRITDKDGKIERQLSELMDLAKEDK